jgi:hypothetical protein
VKKLALPAGIAGIAVCGAVIVGSILHSTLPPMATAPSPTASVTSCEEDMPCWTCSPADDRVTGSSDEYACTAWQTFEEAGGAKSLKVDPSRPFRVDYMMSTDTYPENMDKYDLALVGKDFRWYVFRAFYTDGKLTSS